MNNLAKRDPHAKRLALRQLLESRDIVVMPSIYDGFSARLVDDAGFLAAGITGAGLSESHLGKPDVGLLGLEENLTVSKYLVQSTSIPLIADGDTGYGSAVNVYFTVQAFEDIGVAGVMLEDQTWPKRCGHLAGKQVISADEMVEKIHAATDARCDSSLVIKARTDAAGPISVKEAIRRLNLYADAGADLLFADALLNEADIERVAAEVSKPLVVNMGFGIRSRPTTPLIPARRLEAMGVAAVVYSRILTAAAVQGMKNAIAALRETLGSEESSERPDLLVSFEELQGLMGIDSVRELEMRYATKKS